MVAAAEWWAERAAIMEHLGLMPRADAEIAALGEVAVRFGWDEVVGMGVSDGEVV